MPKPEINQFFDIGRLPKSWGMIVFPISMSKILNDQSAEKTLDHLRIFQPSKISENKVGITILYSDGLYQWKKGSELIPRRKTLELMNNHRNSYIKNLDKSSFEFQIKDAFDFVAWNQISISTSGFMAKYNKVFDLVKEDPDFKKYLEEDCKYYGRECDEDQIGFFVEEILTFYLITKMKISFNNLFTQNREEWVLLAYPGKPLKTLAYFYQKNIFGLNNTGNEYENCFYDLKSKKLYDFSKLDLKTWNYE